MTVRYGRRTKPSALALQQALLQAGYTGPDINFGYGIARNALNKPEAIKNVINKRRMRELFAEHEVPAPKLLNLEDRFDWKLPVVGRPDTHRQGRGFWLCKWDEDVIAALQGRRRTRQRRGKVAASHFMEYIPIEREFRVHIVNGKSIKISEKIGLGNHRTGARFQYPHDFNHKKTLRKAARNAIAALGLDFGAVDIGWYDGAPYVFEVNTAPCLTDDNSDTLQRYTTAFKTEYGDNGGDDNNVAIRGDAIQGDLGSDDTCDDDDDDDDWWYDD